MRILKKKVSLKPDFIEDESHFNNQDEHIEVKKEFSDFTKIEPEDFSIQTENSKIKEEGNLIIV